jgi:thioredoxin-related protein
MEMKNLSLFYLKYIKIVLFLIILFLSVVQCQNQNTNEKVIQVKDELSPPTNQDIIAFRLLLKDSFNIELADYKYILYFTNNGCVGCNDRYFRVLNKNLFKQDVLTIFSGDESDFDFNKINPDKENQIIDKKMIFRDISYLQLPSIIKIRSSEIDTIYTVNASFAQFDSIMSTMLIDKSILYE